MPWAVAGAAIGAAGSLAAGSMQSSAVSGGSKAAARAQEEARIIAQQNLTNTLGAVGPRLEAAGDRSNAAITGADTTAAGQLGTYYTGASQQITDAGTAATNYLNQGRDTIGAGVTNANALLQPYIDQGGRALKLTGDLSGANGVDAGRAAMANFEFSPGYQFALEQGLRAVDAGASARGMLVSGGTRIAEQKFGQGLAAQDFASYYNRLAGLAGQGLSASNTAGNNIMQGAAGQSGIDRAQAQTALTQGGALAGISTGLGGQLAQNSMTTGGRLAQNEQQTAAQISNLYTGNASQQAQIGTNTAAQQAQTATSAAGAQANITGNMMQGFGNAITSGLNNYTYLNALGPQSQGQQQAPYTGYSNPSMLPSDYQYLKPVVS